jgi:hypothetical protein
MDWICTLRFTGVKICALQILGVHNNALKIHQVLLLFVRTLRNSAVQVSALQESLECAPFFVNNETNPI